MLGPFFVASCHGYSPLPEYVDYATFPGMVGTFENPDWSLLPVPQDDGQADSPLANESLLRLRDTLGLN